MNAAYDKFDLDGKKMRMNNFVSNVSEISNDKNKLFKERERLVRLYEQKKMRLKRLKTISDSSMSRLKQVAPCSRKWKIV